MNEGVNKYQIICGKENSLGFICRVDINFWLHHFPGCRPVTSNHILSKDMSYLVTTMFKFFYSDFS